MEVHILFAKGQIKVIDIRINVKQSEVTPDTSWDIHKAETYKVINAWANSVHFSYTVIRIEVELSCTRQIIIYFT